MSRPIFRAITLGAAGSLLLASLAYGQRNPPPPDDPEVHYSFFVFMDGFGQWLEARAQENPARRTRLMESASRYLKITPADLPKVIAACRASAVELKAIEAQSKEYWQSEVQKKKIPDNAKARQFEAMRQAAIQAGRTRLQQALPPGSWTGLQAHINGSHRLGIQRN
jgi:hypothetical protein